VCQTDADCPADFACKEATGSSGGKALQCVRKAGVCTCNAKASLDGAKTTCSVANSFGSCSGERSCGPDGLQACSAPTPASETCNEKDDDCDGQTDEPGSGCISYWSDKDGDGYGTGKPNCQCGPGGGFTATKAGDCNDDDATVNPGKKELCGNAKDDDCNGKQDEPGAANCIDFWPDADSDGWGSGEGNCLCGPTGTYTVKKGGDCDDQSPKISPAALEVCNGQDDDCDGNTDEADAVGCVKFWADSDGDGFGKTDDSACLCKPDAKYKATQGGDCDDANPKASGGSKETCDGADNDCDGQTDEAGAQGCKDAFTDGDGDGFGSDKSKACLCPAQSAGKAGKGGDCDDGNAKVNPAAKEVCNGVDDDCNGVTDDEKADGCTIWLYDEDGDGYGVLAQAKCLCGAQKPWSTQKGEDCDDTDPAVKPKAQELCNGKDDDCDGDTDEVGAQGCVPYFPDGDGDGFGALGVPSQCLCKPDGAYKALASGDCNDADKAIYPKAPESCDGKDTDCDGIVDPIGAQGCKTWFQDADQDGYGNTTSQCACGPMGLFTASKSGDCNDESPQQKPGATEICNGIDDNCNGQTDTDAVDAKPYYADADGDGWGAGGAKIQCGPAGGYTATQGGDCADQDAKVNPGATEVCNGKDDNCTNGIDEGTGAQLCPPASGSAVVCQGGKCGLQCSGKQFDVDGNYGNGCECTADGNFGVAGGACTAAMDVGSLSDVGSVAQRQGNIMPGEAGDWYRFKAVDTPDSGGACDKFHVKAQLVGNPGGGFLLDLYRGGCGGIQQLCAGQTDAGWTVNFYGAQPSGPGAGTGTSAGAVVKSPSPEKAGECKCTASPGLPGMNVCADNTADFFVRVYRAASAGASCAAYTLQVSNGL
jgi:hypothetical protein